MTRRYAALLLTLALASTAGLAVDSAPPRFQMPAAPTAAPEISGERIRAHVEFLASDALEGRETGTRGYDVAALYAATQLELAGLQPAGDAGSFFQRVPLRRASLESSAVTISTADGKAIAASVPDDLLVWPNLTAKAVDVTAPVVFAGYGVTAPEQGYDDYAGLDVKGKVVLVVSNAPPTFPSETRAHFASVTVKLRTAAEHGAIGVLRMAGAEDRKRYTWQQTQSFAEEPVLTWVTPSGDAGTGDGRLAVAAAVSPDLASRLLATAGLTVAQVDAAANEGRVQSRPLPITCSVQMTSRWEEISSVNVVGRLAGSDPTLADTSVVLTAHLDHTGLGRPVDGDRIYNGAYDNATGAAIVLELARAFAAAPKRPRRSVVFVLLTAEEQGLLGSQYFAKYPGTTVGRIVANVNLDMPLFLTASSDVTAFGAENSTLDIAVAEAVKRVGFTLSPDPLPQENLFVRSDQYSFVKQGIPAVYLIPGFTSTDPNVKGGELVNQFMRQHYHRPSDDLSRPMDVDAAARFTLANYYIVEAVANEPLAPTWKPGNFFGRMYGTR